MHGYLPYACEIFIIHLPKSCVISWDILTDLNDLFCEDYYGDIHVINEDILVSYKKIIIEE